MVVHTFDKGKVGVLPAMADDEDDLQPIFVDVTAENGVLAEELVTEARIEYTLRFLKAAIACVINDVTERFLIASNHSASARMAVDDFTTPHAIRSTVDTLIQKYSDYTLRSAIHGQLVLPPDNEMRQDVASLFAPVCERVQQQIFRLRQARRNLLATA